jgi:cytochrome c oxidase subunit III
MSTAAQDPHAHAEDAEHAHNPHLAHHFDTPEQQFSTGKLGMWTFLATEVLMFGGLFCAYAVYRYNHPQVYLWSHHALDATWGMINTIVLLASSFTMAWGVRAAQLNQRGLLLLMLALTFLGGCGFMVIKGVEYNSKWKHALFPGKYNAFNMNFGVGEQGVDAAAVRQHTVDYVESHATPGGHGVESAEPAHSDTKDPAHPATGVAHGETSLGDTSHANPQKPAGTTVVAPVVRPIAGLSRDAHAGTTDATSITPPAYVASGINPAADAKPGHTVIRYDNLQPADRATLNTFFSIYFMMTGLHGVHVVVGMGLIAWLFLRAYRGEFSSQYFTPVDLGGLYWHLVDLIWIFLFPLLYLIH